MSEGDREKRSQELQKRETAYAIMMLTSTIVVLVVGGTYLIVR